MLMADPQFPLPTMHTRSIGIGVDDDDDDPWELLALATVISIRRARISKTTGRRTNTCLDRNRKVSIWEKSEPD